METNFPSFHEDAQFTTNSFISSDEMMKDHLKILDGIKVEENILWPEESVLNETVVGKEDFQQIMSDWQSHVSALKMSEPEPEDVALDLLQTSSSSPDVLFDEKSPILSKALNNVFSKSTPSALLGVKKETDFETDPCDMYMKIQSDHFNMNVLKPESPTIVRKLTLLNGEKELLGKNIIGLHSLNEIKENPDENCQVTSTVINGKRYKIIIKPKSTKLQKYTEEKIRKTIIKRLTRCNLTPKTTPAAATTTFEPKEDELISEMRNGNYDVPILESDTLLSWDMTWCDTTPWDNTAAEITTGLDVKEEATGEEEAMPKKVPPLKIKIPKMKKCKRKNSELRSDEEIDVETVGERMAEAGNKAAGQAKMEELSRELQRQEDNGNDGQDQGGSGKTKKKKKSMSSNDSIKKSLPKEMVDRIESLKRKKDGRIPLVQVIPVRKNITSGTRMQDAAATITRNKLLKIVSGGDTVQLDHDYCSNTLRNFEEPQKKSLASDLEVNLSEKNPKKDSGMESGDVSDASEEPQTPESAQNIQSIQQINNKLLEERRIGRTSGITKAAAALFRAANVIRSNGNVNANSDIVKTSVVSNGNKALTNNSPDATSSLSQSPKTNDKSDIVPSCGSNSTNNGSSESSSQKCNSGDVAVIKSLSDDIVEGSGGRSAVGCAGDRESGASPLHVTQPERPKKKLKLEEYLSRRNTKSGAGTEARKELLPRENQNVEEKNATSTYMVQVEVSDSAERGGAESRDAEDKAARVNTKDNGNGERKRRESESLDHPTSSRRRRRSHSSSSSSSCSSNSCKNGTKNGGSGKKSRRRRSERSSSSTSSGERDDRRGREKSSRSSWRESRRDSWNKHKYRNSTSSERRRSFWSRSLSRSSSRESTSSSDRSASRRKRKSSPWYRRRSRSRSVSRDRSRSRNRRYSNRRRHNHYFNRNVYSRRSRSPFHAFSVREKQRQIEERRVIYIGRIEEGMSSAKLRERFSVFGPIIDISLHFREHGDNYGFVTYAYKDDAYDAVEHGNDDPNLPRYDLCFGGRRGFCREKYADLDGMPTSYSGFKDSQVNRAEESFDLLLKKAQAKLKKRINKNGNS